MRGTRIEWPFNLPSNSGKIIPIAFAEPVIVSIKHCDQLLALLKSGLNVSTITCVLVRLWSVVMLA